MKKLAEMPEFDLIMTYLKDIADRILTRDVMRQVSFVFVCYLCLYCETTLTNIVILLKIVPCSLLNI